MSHRIETLDRDGRPVVFANGTTTALPPTLRDADDTRKVTGLRPLRQGATITVTASIVTTVEEPTLPTATPGMTGKLGKPQPRVTHLKAGAKQMVTAKPLPSALPYAEHARWICQCKRMGSPDGRLRDFSIPCPHGASFKSLAELRAAHPSDAVLDRAGSDEGFNGEVHVFFCQHEIPATDTSPASVAIYTIDGALA